MSPDPSAPNPLTRTLAHPTWAGIAGVATIIALLVPLAVAGWELVTGNVRLLLWLQLQAYAVPGLLLLLGLVAVAALFVAVAWRKEPALDAFDAEPTIRRAPRFGPWLRLGAMFVFLLAVALGMMVTTGYNQWRFANANKTTVWIADFLDPDGKDSLDLTRDLYTRVRDALKEHPSVEVRTLGWPVEDARGEGGDLAREAGELLGASIVIWGDYVLDPEMAVYVHFDLIHRKTELLERKSMQIFGHDQMQAIATDRPSDLPATVVFKSVLGEQLGYLVAFASGIALFDSNSFERAAQFFDTASQIYENPLAIDMEIPVRYVRGSTYGLLGDSDLAIEELTAALAAMELVETDQGVEPASVLNNRGNAYANTGQYELALADFPKAIEYDDADAYTYVNRANTFMLLGQLDDALRDFDQALNISPLDAGIYSNRGTVHGQMGNLAAARADFDSAIELDPEFAPAYSNRGELYLTQGNAAAAIQDQTHALDLYPEFVVALMGRGAAYRQLHEYDLAIADYSVASGIEPQIAEIFYELGNVYLDMQSLDQAIAF